MIDSENSLLVEKIQELKSISKAQRLLSKSIQLVVRADVPEVPNVLLAERLRLKKERKEYAQQYDILRQNIMQCADWWNRIHPYEKPEDRLRPEDVLQGHLNEWEQRDLKMETISAVLAATINFVRSI